MPIRTQPANNAAAPMASEPAARASVRMRAAQRVCVTITSSAFIPSVSGAIQAAAWRRWVIHSGRRTPMIGIVSNTIDASAQMPR